MKRGGGWQDNTKKIWDWMKNLISRVFTRKKSTTKPKSPDDLTKVVAKAERIPERPATSPTRRSPTRPATPPKRRDGYNEEAERRVLREVAHLGFEPGDALFKFKEFEMPTYLSGFEPRIIHAVGEGTCLLHAILLLLSPTYRNLSDEEGKLSERGATGRAVRSRFHAHSTSPPFSPDAGSEMEHDSLMYFCRKFRMNAVCIDKTLDRVLTFDKFIQEPFFIIYCDRGHFDAMKLNGRYFVDRPAYDRLMRNVGDGKIYDLTILD